LFGHLIDEWAREVEITTGTLGEDQLEFELTWAHEFFRSQHVGDLKVMYGWACNLDIDEQYKWIPLSVNELPSFIRDSVHKGIYRIGRSDLWIVDAGSRFEFLFCHESDVHFKSESAEVLVQVREIWRTRGYSGYERQSDKADWTKW
jgi:hypothetical protein